MSAINIKNRHQAYLQVRRQLERSFGSKFKEATWSRMLASGMVREYAAGDVSLVDLSSYAEEALEFQRELGLEFQRELGLEISPEHEEGGEDAANVGPGEDPSRPARPRFAVELPGREQKRATVLLEIQMRQAAEHPDVVRFRDEHLEGRLLSADGAETYFDPGLRAGTSDQELAKLGRRLGRDYGWHRDDAAWFVLTGEPPTLHPLATDFFMNESIYGPSYCVLTLRAAPWIPPEEIEKAFVEMRDQVRGAAGPGMVGEQRLEVLRFVEEACAKCGQRPNFRTLLKMWNQEHPHWSYNDYRALSKAYREARQEVLYPEYHSPRRESTPNMERQEARNRRLFEKRR